MCLMTSCVMSARVHAVQASLHRSSAPVSCACSTTVSSAGCRFTRGLAASTTSHLSRRELIGQGHFRSVGVKPSCTSFIGAYSTFFHFINICYFSGFQWFLSIFIVKKLIYCIV